ncbi:MAG TPA: hypothetical protein VFC31_03665 [Candidatus Limnocylindria bacterium]|nr:hypothetical protein [Candidatus Limnocylindria bacterium]
MNRRFRRLWAGEGISVVGSNITLLALPLTAAPTLSATPQEMGLLTAAGWLRVPLFSVSAGAWSDRLRREPVLVVAFLAGSMTALFRAAYVPFIPTPVVRNRFIRGVTTVALRHRAVDGRRRLPRGPRRAHRVRRATFNVTTATAFQAAIPDRLHGRVGGTGQVLGLVSVVGSRSAASAR